VFHLAGVWGEVRVSGVEIRPDTTYTVRTLCDFVGGRVSSAGSDITTFRWGDANGDRLVNVIDITSVVDAVKQVLNPSVPFEAANMWPCAIDRVVNVADITAAVDAVKSTGYPCPLTCP